MSAPNLDKTAVKTGVDNRRVLLSLEVSTMVPIAASTGASQDWEASKADDGPWALWLDHET